MEKNASEPERETSRTGVLEEKKRSRNAETL